MLELGSKGTGGFILFGGEMMYNGYKCKDFFQFINSRSKIVPLSVEIALDSGRFKSQMRKKYKQFGLADAVIYLTAKLNDSKLLTGDPHFKGLEGVEYIK